MNRRPKLFRRTTGVVLLASLWLITGCVTHTTVKNEARRSVRFESSQAAQTFYDAYLTRSYCGPAKSTFAVWIASPYWHHTAITDNVRFNAAVKTADRDRDGTITAAEADAYAAGARPRAV